MDSAIGGGGGVQLSDTRIKVDTASPTTGQTVAFTNDDYDRMLVLSPAGALAALTVTFPTGTRVGQVCWVTTNQAITALTVSGTTVSGLVTSMSGEDMYAYAYVGGNKWRRCL